MGSDSSKTVESAGAEGCQATKCIHSYLIFAIPIL